VLLVETTLFEVSLVVLDSVDVETDVLSASEEVCPVDLVFELALLVVVSLELELEEEEEEEKELESEFPETLLVFTGVLSVESVLTACAL